MAGPAGRPTPGKLAGRRQWRVRIYRSQVTPPAAPTPPPVLRHWSAWHDLRGAGRDRRIPRIRACTGSGVPAGSPDSSTSGRRAGLAGEARAARRRLSRADALPRSAHRRAGAVGAAPPGRVRFRGRGDRSPRHGPGTQGARGDGHHLVPHRVRAIPGGQLWPHADRLPDLQRQQCPAGRRYHGGPDPAALAGPASVPVNGLPGADPASANWMNWTWAPWVPISQARRSAAGTGLYRVRSSCHAGRAYVGQGAIVLRLRAHAAKALSA